MFRIEATETESEGVAALRSSLASLIAELQEKDRQLEEITYEHNRIHRENKRLRSELNEAHAAKAEKMMDVAMAASVRAMEDDAANAKRSQREHALLAAEIALLENALAPSAAMIATPTAWVRGSGATGCTSNHISVGEPSWWPSR